MNTMSIIANNSTNSLQDDIYARAKDLLSCFCLSESALRNIAFYTASVIETGKFMNLTTLTEIDDILIKHFYDCMFPIYNSKYVLEGKSLLDIGTGAGFPGMPIKMLVCGVRLSLLETTLKKINFVNSVNSQIGLLDIEYVNMRAEDAARTEKYRESFDYCTSRAVAQLNVLLELSIPFLKTGGLFFSYKSIKSQEEIEGAKTAMEKLGCFIQEVIDYELPLDMGSRALLVIKKETQTNVKYPRSFAKIKKAPL